MQKEEFLINTLQRKAFCATLYNQTQSITFAQCRIQAQYRKYPPSCNSHQYEWKILIESERMSREIESEGLHQQVKTLKLFAACSEFI